jgi:two-component sensor histidine kinase
VANVCLSGPPIALNSRCAVTLGMAVHELTTNAAKYGALSAEDGRVEVTWELEPCKPNVTIRWVETGGPQVTPPKTSGFGRLLLERALASDLTGKVHLDFAAEGLTCIIVLPLDQCMAK